MHIYLEGIIHLVRHSIDWVFRVFYFLVYFWRGWLAGKPKTDCERALSLLFYFFGFADERQTKREEKKQDFVLPNAMPARRKVDKKESQGRWTDLLTD